MRKLEAIIKPLKIDDVKSASREDRRSRYDGHRSQRLRRTGGKAEVYRGSASEVDFVPQDQARGRAYPTAW